MTKLQKAIRRELAISVDRRQWIVELQPWGLDFHAKREKKHFQIAWETALLYAIRLHVDKERSERQKTRRAR
jgi:hypothetical protein